MSLQGNNQHVNTFFGNDRNEENAGTGGDITDEPSDLPGTKILTSNGGETIRGKVAGRKRDHEIIQWWKNPRENCCTTESSTQMGVYQLKATMP